MTIQTTHQDVVAAQFRNALLNALPSFDYFRKDYDQVDAQILEAAYRRTDDMKEEDVEMYYQAITMGGDLAYDRDTESFFPLETDK